MQFQFTPLREGRRQIYHNCQANGLFQFTPLREGRPKGKRRLACEPPNFNSRPSARGDERSYGWKITTEAFQFTPLREGRPARQSPPGSSPSISIHAPPRGATIRFLRMLQRLNYFNSRPSARGDGKRYAISANLLFNPYKSAWLNNSATQFVEIILVIFHRIIA